jgi:hypothetical protein
MLNRKKPKIYLEKLQKIRHIYNEKSDAASLSGSEGDLPNSTELNQDSVTSMRSD